MTFWQRLKLYLIGFVIGLFILFIILGKKGGCAGGGLSERKMSELLTQTWKLNEQVRCKLNCIGFTNDTLFKTALKTCHVNYDKSEPRAEPCGKYVLETPPGPLSFTLLVQDCKTVSEVLDINTQRSCECN